MTYEKKQMMTQQQDDLRQRVWALHRTITFKELAEYIEISAGSFRQWYYGNYNFSPDRADLLTEVLTNLEEPEESKPQTETEIINKLSPLFKRGFVPCEGEEFRYIPNTDKKYIISNYGNVISLFNNSPYLL